VEIYNGDIQMSRFKVMQLCAVILTIAVLPSAAYANAHCWCRLGSPSSPYKDFGALATFGGQSGHDSFCHDLCSQTVTNYMANQSNYNAICNAAHWGSLAAYSCVGTRPWSNAWTATCNSPNVPAPGALSFYNYGATDLTIKINNVSVPVNNNTQQITQIASTPNFTTFFLVDPLHFHWQSWTFTAQLYRDNVLVEVFSKKSPWGSALNAVTIFTQQPNWFVYGHVWKIVWTYAGPNQPNGASSYFIP
jgi:hypothetical protein